MQKLRKKIGELLDEMKVHCTPKSSRKKEIVDELMDIIKLELQKAHEKGMRDGKKARG